MPQPRFIEAMTTDFVQTLQKVESVCFMLSKMSSKSIEEAVSRIGAIHTFMERYGDLGKLCEHFKELESKTRETLTIDEAAEYLGISKSYMYRLTAEHELTYHKPLGKQVYIQRTELDKFKMRNVVPSKYDKAGRAAATTVSDSMSAKSKKKGKEK